MNDKAKSNIAIKKCAEWLGFCLKIGWGKEQLDALEELWWEWHDDKTGELCSKRKNENILTN